MLLIFFFRCTVEQTVIMNSWFIAILFIVYALIFIIGICGNCLVIYVIVSRKEMKSNTNYYILNLAIADVLMCLCKYASLIAYI